jgi:hypothetical protein
LSACVAFLGEELLFDKSAQVIEQNAAQPPEQLLLGPAAKLFEMAARLEEGFLHSVRGAGPPLQVQIDLCSGQKVEVVAVQFQ